MGLLDPVPPPYDPLEWDRQPFPVKARMVCRSWALQGYGTPVAAFGFHALKIALYVAGWMLACRATPGLGDPLTIGQWWAHPIAFQKAILWSLLFEGLGLGCGSGPLTGRYWPPVGGALYFLRPGTTKLPLWPRLPGLGGHTRGVLDVVLYLALVVALVGALASPTLGPAQLWPVAILVPLLGLSDKTLFLAVRAEHYWVTVLCFVLAPGSWIAGAKWVALALWLWAGVSKLNHHFPSVVCVMTSNSPVLRWRWLRQRMYRRYPDDLRPSRLAERLAHGGTALELAVPLVLVLTDGGPGTAVGLLLMVLLHAHITSSVPMGVPLEWNVVVVYGGFVLFGAHPELSPWAVGSGPLVAVLIVMLLVVPLLGNLRPHAVSFLPAMRYYAGNWAYSVWLFRGDGHERLERLTKSTPWIFTQLERFYDRATSVGLVGKVIGFRLMHLHGRALPLLLPKAVDRLEDYVWIDGELVAGLVLGWNFGDGHLHDERLLAAVQAQCGWEPGELRCIFVESQPLFDPRLHWRIWDAATGMLDEGHVEVARLRQLPPWPEDHEPADAPAA